MNISESELGNENKKNQESYATFGNIKKDKEEILNIKISNKTLNNLYYKYYSNKEEEFENNESIKKIKLKIPLKKEIKNEIGQKDKDEENNIINNNNEEKKENLKNIYENHLDYSRAYSFEHKENIDSVLFNKLKEEILNKKN